MKLLRRRKKPRCHILNLPNEILLLIIEEALHFRRKARKRDAGTPSHSSAVSILSQVHSRFSKLCFPLIWKCVDLNHKSDSDYQYFIDTIVPRHGDLIKLVRPIIFDALSNPLPDSTRNGTRSRIGQQCQSFTRTLASAFFRSGSDDNVSVTRASLLARILSPNSLPNILELSLYLQESAEATSELISCLQREFKGNSCRLEFLNVNFAPDNTSAGANPYLGQLIGSCKNLQTLWLHRTAGPHHQANVLLCGDSFFNHSSLKILSIDSIPLDHTWLASTWSTPLTQLSLFDTNLSYIELINFISKFDTTLIGLFLGFSKDAVPSATTSTPTPPPPSSPPGSLHFSRLKVITVNADVPSGFFTSFQHAPLWSLDLTTYGGGLKASDVFEILEAHGDTLMHVHLRMPHLSLRDWEQIDVVAKCHGIGLSLRR